MVEACVVEACVVEACVAAHGGHIGSDAMVFGGVLQDINAGCHCRVSLSHAITPRDVDCDACLTCKVYLHQHHILSTLCEIMFQMADTRQHFENMLSDTKAELLQVP